MLWKHGKETIMSKKTYLGIMILFMTLALIFSAGCVDTQENRYGPINITSDAVLVEYNQSVNLSAEQSEGLALTWSLNDELLGELNQTSNNEAVFTPYSKSGVAIITVTAPHNLKSEVVIKIFAPPTLSIEIPSGSRVEMSEDCKYLVSYPKDGSVTVDEIYLTNEYNEPVSGLNTSRGTICLKTKGIYNLTIVGHDFLGRNIQDSEIFSIVYAVEVVMGAPDPRDLKLKSFSRLDIASIENTLLKDYGLNVSLNEIFSNGKTINGNGKSFVAILFVKDLDRDDAWAMADVNIFDYYPKDKFKEVTVTSSVYNNSWKVIIGYNNDYVSQVTCVAAFPTDKDYSFYTSPKTNFIVSSDDSSSEGGSGGGIIPPPAPAPTASGPSPKPL